MVDNDFHLENSFLDNRNNQEIYCLMVIHSVFQSVHLGNLVKSCNERDYITNYILYILLLGSDHKL